MCRELGVPVVRETWLNDCIEKMEYLPVDPYRIADVDDIPWDKRRSDEEAEVAVRAPLKMYGKRSVYTDTELQDEGGKIYEKNDIIYNCAFSMCDIYIDLNQLSNPASAAWCFFSLYSLGLSRKDY
jgi:poly [ADP-ribose] polymerase